MTPNEKLLYVSSHRERNLRLPKMGTDIESHSQILSIETLEHTTLNRKLNLLPQSTGICGRGGGKHRRVRKDRGHHEYEAL